MSDFQLPDELDPETVLVCTSCRMEFTARYQAKVCVDCGGVLMALDGTLVEPGELSHCRDCGQPFDAGISPFCPQCCARRLGLAVVSPDDAETFYREGLIQDGDREEFVLAPFATDNPYMQRLFAHELYGRVPEACREMLNDLATVHPDEKFLTAMRVRHGQREGGFLMVTTHFLRYVKAGRIVTILRRDELWPLDSGIEAEGMLGPGVIRTETGHQFQIWGMKAKKLVEFYRLAQLAMAWAANEDDTDRQALHDAAAVVTVASGVGETSATKGLASEIAELSLLRDQGILSDEEFAAAKAKLLAS